MYYLACFMLLSLLSFIDLSVAYFTNHPIASTLPVGTIMDIDQDIQFGQIPTYTDEWNTFWNRSGEVYPVSPFMFWFRCYERQVRGN